MSANIRTFRAEDARSALAAVKAAFGSEAIIVSTREVSGGLFRKPEIEVTAALSDPQAPLEVPRPSPAPAPALEQPVRRGYFAAQPVSQEDALPDVGCARELGEAAQAADHPARRKRSSTRRGWTRSGRELVEHLCGRGVEEALAEEAVQSAMAGAGPGPGALVTALRSQLAERLIPGRAPWLKDRPRVIALVGPTGVGKTTTLAKIAARGLMESRLRISLITVDTYRIGATEQMARYGEIMNVPTYVAKDRAELAKAISQSEGADLILIDTAGRSMPEAVAKQAELIRTVPSAQLYLVVSAATGSRELSAVAERYRGLSPERLIVTKVDEAAGPGSLLTAAVRVDRPIVAVADGQRVPEDLHDLSGSQLVDLVVGSFGAKRGERDSAGRQ